MRMYFASLGAGILMGVIYGVLHVRSPAPPLVALVGLLGMLVGQQAISSGRGLLPSSSPYSQPHAEASRATKP